MRPLYAGKRVSRKRWQPASPPASVAVELRTAPPASSRWMNRPASSIDPAELLANAGWVRALARNLLSDSHKADDVVQGTLVAAIEHPPAPDVPLRPWLARVARNLSFQTM